ncbi:hypothetical protein GZ78_08935 [Endozoicomonas numazuensis]|uniref:Uncharacterized protein n=1 Tax=Endozoicomonas numazuensis TaxID=1137799 RepID=A0A081NH60_9GAMM|nr:hypothetical protein GZ78_08935 [Endozoicomonas numazuensis]
MVASTVLDRAVEVNYLFYGFSAPNVTCYLVFTHDYFVNQLSYLLGILLFERILGIYFGVDDSYRVNGDKI